MSGNIDGGRLFEGSSIKQGYSDAISIALDDPRVKAALKGTGLEKAKVATHSLRKAAASYAAIWLKVLSSPRKTSVHGSGGGPGRSRELSV